MQVLDACSGALTSFNFTIQVQGLKGDRLVFAQVNQQELDKLETKHFKPCLSWILFMGFVSRSNVPGWGMHVKNGCLQQGDHDSLTDMALWGYIDA